MRRFAFLVWLLSIEVGMAACVAPTAASRAEALASDTGAWLEQESDPPEHEEGLTFLCSESQSSCALFRREGENARAGSDGRIILARGVGPTVEPFLESASASRYWGSAQGLPEDSSPVFIIPWHNHDRRPLLPPALEQAIQDHIAGPGRLVKHHIFPQEFKEWFTRKDINIHAETMLLEQHVHVHIHRGANGGPWNAAWRQFIRVNPDAPKEEIWRYAGELIHRFDIDGPILPYYGRVALPCSFMWRK